MFTWVKEHKRIVIAILLFLIVGVPLIIHILFKIDSGVPFLEAEWTAGDALGFYGSLLAFSGTVILGTLTLYQNQIIKEEADKRAKMIEQREYDMQMPKFSIKPYSSNGNCTNLQVYLKNISENVASEIVVYDIKVISSDGKVLWSSDHSITYDSISSDNQVNLNLTNPALKDSYVLIFTLQCKDKFEVMHTYMVRGIYEGTKTFPDFKVTEIK